MSSPSIPDSLQDPDEDTEKKDSDQSIGSLLFWNPVLQTLSVMCVVSIVGWTAFMGAGGVTEPFVFTTPLDEHPESIILSIYAHANTTHLISNATVIAIVGGIISLNSSWIRFHLFFIFSGVVAGVTQAVIMEYYGTAIPALGASGAGFALMGYLAIANPLADYVSGKTISALVLILASGITLYFSPEGSGIMAHFTGAVIGLIAGRFHLLRAK
ncbi:rhomboid family intramembrane serine protease [Halorubrum tebenquichense]|uniref:Rhomboid family protein n=1 Tax=Halorubrum tebenquichense DSM 14210 TaxID=1227485 RepID=M0E0U0_9EURY|nr:rhomboid family intramembrane serine protease [Halorubrum tebenquichense]ELZ39964.1 rhomboid family protein [Halorubrum tebenquichense DSM 14210]